MKKFLEAIMPSIMDTPIKAASVSSKMSLVEADLPGVNI
jgi:hypothetical protein